MEELAGHIANDIIGILRKASDKIGQYGGVDRNAADEADSLLRQARGYYNLAANEGADRNIVFQLARLANECKAIRHLDPEKNTKIQQIQADIEAVIKILNHRL